MFARVAIFAMQEYRNIINFANLCSNRSSEFTRVDDNVQNWLKQKNLTTENARQVKSNNDNTQFEKEAKNSKKNYKHTTDKPRPKQRVENAPCSSSNTTPQCCWTISPRPASTTGLHLQYDCRGLSSCSK